ncbi:MAG: hypothetical protein ACLQUT_05375 [Thermoleophilia bacterium]
MKTPPRRCKRSCDYMCAAGHSDDGEAFWYCRQVDVVRVFGFGKWVRVDIGQTCLVRTAREQQLTMDGDS